MLLYCNGYGTAFPIDGGPANLDLLRRSFQLNKDEALYFVLSETDKAAVEVTEQAYWAFLARKMDMDGYPAVEVAGIPTMQFKAGRPGGMLADGGLAEGALSWRQRELDSEPDDGPRDVSVEDGTPTSPGYMEEGIPQLDGPPMDSADETIPSDENQASAPWHTAVGGAGDRMDMELRDPIEHEDAPQPPFATDDQPRDAPAEDGAPKLPGQTGEDIHQADELPPDGADETTYGDEDQASAPQHTVAGNADDPIKTDLVDLTILSRAPSDTDTGLDVRLTDLVEPENTSMGAPVLPGCAGEARSQSLAAGTDEESIGVAPPR